MLSLEEISNQTEKLVYIADGIDPHEGHVNEIYSHVIATFVDHMRRTGYELKIDEYGRDVINIFVVPFGFQLVNFHQVPRINGLKKHLESIGDRVSQLSGKNIRIQVTGMTFDIEKMYDSKERRSITEIFSQKWMEADIPYLCGGMPIEYNFVLEMLDMPLLIDTKKYLMGFSQGGAALCDDYIVLSRNPTDLRRNRRFTRLYYPDNHEEISLEGRKDYERAHLLKGFGPVGGYAYIWHQIGMHGEKRYDDDHMMAASEAVSHLDIKLKILTKMCGVLHYLGNFNGGNLKQAFQIFGNDPVFESDKGGPLQQLHPGQLYQVN